MEQKVRVPWWVAGVVLGLGILELAFFASEEPAGTVAFFTAVMALATVTLVIAALRALRQIDEARKSRHAVTATDFSRRWDSPEMLDARTLVAPYYANPTAFKADFFDLLDNHPEADTSLRMLRQANYLEDLAILEDAGAIDLDFVKQSLGYIVVSRWLLWGPIADEFKKRNGVDNFPNFRRLAGDLEGDPDLA